MDEIHDTTLSGYKLNEKAGATDLKNLKYNLGELHTNN